MKRFITYLIVAAATVYTAILYGSSSFLMLFYVELILPFFLVLTLLPVVRGMSVRLQIPVPVVERGQKTPVVIELRNRSLLPSGKVAVQVTCHLPMDLTSEKTDFYGRMPGGRKQNKKDTNLKAEYEAECVGNIRMEITKVWCYDLLGLLAVPLSEKHWRAIKPETLLVLPKFQDIPLAVSRQSRDFIGESEEYSHERGGDDPSEVFQIRDYQPGDKMRSIHWKLSAKTDHMMVREQSMPLGCPVEFYLNLYQPTVRKNKVSARKRDSFLQIMASLCHSMVREKCRHYVIWFDVERDDIRRYRVENEEDVYEMLLRLGHLMTYQEQKDLQDLYHHKFHEAPGITEIELKTDLTLMMNGDKIDRYDESPKELEKQLVRRELIV